MQELIGQPPVVSLPLIFVKIQKQRHYYSRKENVFIARR